MILNYNGKKHLKTFLPSVLQALEPHHELLIADNGSTDDSIAFLKKNYPTIRRIELDENTGFAEGYNRALRQVQADYYMILNSDVEVTNNWLAPLEALLQKHKNIGAVQPKVLAFAQKDTFEYAGAAGGFLDHWGYPFCRGRILDTCEKDDGQYDTACEIFWSTGAAMLVRANLFHQLGGFDGAYFAHMEEIDLCWRMKRAGYQIWCAPSSTVYHLGGGTLQYESPRKTYLNFHNNLVTIFKNEATSKLLWLLPLRLVLDGVAGGLFLIKGKFAHIGSIIKAHWTFFPAIFKWAEKRKSDKQLIEQARIGEARKEGQYSKSIILQYYIKGKKAFKNL